MAMNVAAVAGLLIAISACVGSPERSAGGAAGAAEAAEAVAQQTGPADLDVGQVASQPQGSGRFRVRSEAGIEGDSVIESVVVGAFDEGTGSFEAALDLKRLLASAQGSVLDGVPPGLGDELVVRAASGLVFVKADARGWILLPGSLDDVLVDAGIVRPDALLDLLNHVGAGVVAVDGDVIEGDTTTLYSGWLDPDALAGMGTPGEATAAGAGSGLGPLTGIDGSAVPSDVLDRLVRFDVWIDGRGRARRLVVELDRDAVAEIARRVDGTDAGIAQLRLRHEVEWFDLDSGVTIEAPPRSEVSVIDVGALGGGEDREGNGYGDPNGWWARE